MSSEKNTDEQNGLWFFDHNEINYSKSIGLSGEKLQEFVHKFVEHMLAAPDQKHSRGVEYFANLIAAAVKSKDANKICMIAHFANASVMELLKSLFLPKDGGESS